VLVPGNVRDAGFLQALVKARGNVILFPGKDLDRKKLYYMALISTS
jgi:hypothetical protein